MVYWLVARERLVRTGLAGWIFVSVVALARPPLRVGNVPGRRNSRWRKLRAVRSYGFWTACTAFGTLVSAGSLQKTCGMNKLYAKQTFAPADWQGVATLLTYLRPTDSGPRPWSSPKNLCGPRTYAGLTKPFTSMSPELVVKIRRKTWRAIGMGSCFLCSLACLQ